MKVRSNLSEHLAWIQQREHRLESEVQRLQTAHVEYSRVRNNPYRFAVPFQAAITDSSELLESVKYLGKDAIDQLLIVRAKLQLRQATNIDLQDLVKCSSAQQSSIPIETSLKSRFAAAPPKNCPTTGSAKDAAILVDENGCLSNSVYNSDFWQDAWDSRPAQLPVFDSAGGSRGDEAVDIGVRAASMSPSSASPRARTRRRRGGRRHRCQRIPPSSRCTSSCSNSNTNSSSSNSSATAGTTTGGGNSNGNSSSGKPNFPFTLRFRVSSVGQRSCRSSKYVCVRSQQGEVDRLLAG